MKILTLLNTSPSLNSSPITETTARYRISVADSPTETEC